MRHSTNRQRTKWLWAVVAVLVAMPLLPSPAQAQLAAPGDSASCEAGVCAFVEAFLEEDATAYTLQNGQTGRFLDADRDMTVDSSVIAKTDDRWYFVPAGGDTFLLRNGDLGTYLDIDAERREVNQSFQARIDDRWRVEESGVPGVVYIRSVSSGLYLETSGPEVGAARRVRRAKQQWIMAEATPLPPSDYVGSFIALQNAATEKWLHVDRFQNARTTDRAEDSWLIEDAGNGYVYLINQATRRPLDADRGVVNVSTSRLRRADDRWRLLEEDGTITLRNVRFGGNLFGEAEDRNYNATRRNMFNESTQWVVTELEPPAQVDVVFAFDLTGSMGRVLTQAKAEVGDVISELQATAPETDFRFSVVSYEDYPVLVDARECDLTNYSSRYGTPGLDEPFRINQSLSSDPAAVVDAVRSLTTGYGNDGPESYGRVFWEIAQPDTGATLGLREGSFKMIVNFGDNLPHDPNLNEGLPRSGVLDTGIDLGRNGELDCGGDDIDFQDDALAALIDADIRLLHVDSGSLASYWRPWARSTGGAYALLSNRRLTEVIVGLISLPGDDLPAPLVFDPEPDFEDEVYVLEADQPTS